MESLLGFQTVKLDMRHINAISRLHVNSVKL
jgi:hypothetical protein